MIYLLFVTVFYLVGRLSGIFELMFNLLSETLVKDQAIAVNGEKTNTYKLNAPFAIN